MRLSNFAARGAMLALAALIPACSSGGTMPGSMTAAVQATVQKAAGPLSAADLATTASNDAIIDSGSPGTTAAPSVPPSITFDSSLHLIVDLGGTDSAGQPRYPGASGLLLVVASGSISTGGGSGSAAYDVGVTASTALTFLDSVSGDSATIVQGASGPIPSRSSGGSGTGITGRSKGT